MTTIYNWNEVDADTAAPATGDYVFKYKASTGRTVKVAPGQLGSLLVTGSASNASAIPGSVSGITLTSATSLFLSAPTQPGITRIVSANSSLGTAITVQSSGSFLAGGSSWTTLTFLGGSAMFASVSTSMWMPISQVAAAATQIS